MSCFVARARFAMSCFVARARLAMSCFVARVEPMSCSSASITALAFGAGTSMLSSASYSVNSKSMRPPPRMAECRTARHAATDNSVALTNIRTALWHRSIIKLRRTIQRKRLVFQTLIVRGRSIAALGDSVGNAHSTIIVQSSRRASCRRRRSTPGGRRSDWRAHHEAVRQLRDNSRYRQNPFAILICFGVRHSGLNSSGLPTRTQSAFARDVATLNRKRL